MESCSGYVVHYRIISPSSLERWRSGAMKISQWHDSVMARGWGQQCDDTMTMTRCSIAPSFLRHSTIVIESLHHRAIVFFAQALFLRKCRQMWIFIRHTLKIFDCPFIPKTLTILACKTIKNVSNACIFLLLR